MIKNSSFILITFITCVVITSVSYAQEKAHTTKIHQNLFEGHNSAAGKVVTQFHQALKKADKITTRKLLADDVLIFEGGKAERSAKEYAAHHMSADMNYLGAINSELIEHKVKIIGNTAISTSRSKVTGEYKGKALNYVGLETLILEKLNSEWKIIHIHWSN